MFLEKLKYELVVTLTLALCTATLGKSSSHSFNQPSPSQSQRVSSTDGHHIYLLLLNGKSGKPVTDVQVLLKGAGQNSNGNWPQSVRSDTHGMAKFFLADPIPEKVGLSFEINEFSSCSISEFKTEQILQNGVVAENICAVGKIYSSHPPVAGQLLVYGRAVTLWQRIGQSIPFLQLFE